MMLDAAGIILYIQDSAYNTKKSEVSLVYLILCYDFKDDFYSRKNILSVLFLSVIYVNTCRKCKSHNIYVSLKIFEKNPKHPKIMLEAPRIISDF